MATYSDKFSSGWATLYLVVTTESQSITNNTSYLKCVLKIKKNASCDSYNNGDASISMTIAGTKLYSSSSFDISSLGIDSTKTLATKYITVSHNSDGTKSVSCKAKFNSGVSLGSASISNTYKCTTIPRASSFTLSTSSVNVGSKITANISRKSTSFTHTVKFYITGCETTSTSDYCKIYTGIGTSKEFTVPTVWYNKLKSSESITAYCKIITKNSSGSTIGSSVSKSFTVKVPSTIKPKITKISFNFQDIKIGNNTYNNILIQGKNNLNISVIANNPDNYATISTYTYSGPGISSSNGTVTNNSYTTKPSSSGTLSYKVTVKDTRGREDSMTQSISCLPYFKPNFTKKLSANREGDGTKIRCKFSLNYAPINNYNKICRVDILYKEEGQQSQSTKTFTDIVGSNGVLIGNYLLDGLNKDLKCEIEVKVTDLMSESNISNKVSVRGSVKIFNVPQDGNGIAFGKMAAQNDNGQGDGYFESVYPIKAPNIGRSIYKLSECIKDKGLILTNSNYSGYIYLLNPFNLVYVRFYIDGLSNAVSASNNYTTLFTINEDFKPASHTALCGSNAKDFSVLINTSSQIRVIPREGFTTASNIYISGVYPLSSNSSLYIN